MGHIAKMMPPQFVKPYVKSNKNDQNDAAGIAKAVTRPSMRFVPIKTTEQQDMLLSHRCRSLLLKQRTALFYQIRGLLGEFGVVIPQGMCQIRALPDILDSNGEKITERANTIFINLHGQYFLLAKPIVCMKMSLLHEY